MRQGRTPPTPARSSTPRSLIGGTPAGGGRCIANGRYERYERYEKSDYWLLIVGLFQMLHSSLVHLLFDATLLNKISLAFFQQPS